MALISEESTSREIAGVNMVTVELDENDIPGAALSSPFERHTVPELKWWLQILEYDLSLLSSSSRRRIHRLRITGLVGKRWKETVESLAMARRVCPHTTHVSPGIVHECRSSVRSHLSIQFLLQNTFNAF